jgi:hypothetical protein
MYLVPSHVPSFASTTNAAEPLTRMRDALGAMSQEICDTSHKNYGSRFTRFGKRSMLLYNYGMHAFTRLHAC